MKEEFLNWFGSQIRQCHVDNDPGVSATSELFALDCGPTPTLISVNSCVVNGVSCVVPSEAFKDDQYILSTQVKQCFYLEDMARQQPHWKVVEHVNHKKFSDGGVIVVKEDPDVIHFDNSSDLPLSTSLNDLDNATLHIDGQSTEVDAPPDIIDLDEDDDIIDDEDALPHDLADSDDEDLVNVDDDDGVDVMSADVARGHGGDGGGDDRPPTHHIPTGCGGCFVNRGKGTRKPNLGGRKAGRLHTRQETRNLGLKKITDDKGPVPIRFEWDDKKTMMPLGDHASHWSNYLGELIREMPLYYPSWQKVPAERKAAIVTKIGWHLQKLYNTNKASLKASHWVINPETGTYDVETIRQGRPESITPADWDAQIAFWNDPRNQARAAQNRQNRAKSTVVCRQGSRSLARLRDEMMASSETREYPSLIDTFFVTHTVNGVFIRDEDRAIYEEMVRLRALGSNTESGVPYTDEEINAMARKGKQRGHLPGVGRVLPGRARDVLIPPPPPPPQCTHNSGDVEKLKKKNNLTENAWVPPSRSGKSPGKESLATCRPGFVSPATCRPGRPGNVAGIVVNVLVLLRRLYGSDVDSSHSLGVEITSQPMSSLRRLEVTLYDSSHIYLCIYLSLSVTDSYMCLVEGLDQKEREADGLKASLTTLMSEVQLLNMLCEERKEAEDSLKKKWKKIEEFDAGDWN
ncbi:hypothetical protein Tco_0843244 [Tanacetum coccineum]|uniref:Uncharacterized protein n=1 Tax=Tanacetum coccineum TaxID=301880 RepID=A0ABQ5B4D1_9ASTR